LAIKTEALGRDALIQVANTSMSSKLLAGEMEFFANMVVDAMLSVKMTNASGQVKYPVKNVHILKTHGKSTKETKLV